MAPEAAARALDGRVVGASWASTLLSAGALAGFLAVAAGAIGSHALSASFVDGGAERWALAADYHGMHALATLAAAWACDRWPDSFGARAAGVCFLLGILLFCGGLYLRAVGSTFPLIQLVPVGGSIWLVGWLSLAVAPWTNGSRDRGL